MRPVNNPPNPWQSTHVAWIDAPPPAQMRVYEEDARSILSHNNSSDLGFSWSINPYRGCFHGCSYCYARPTHQYLDFGAGTDFERKLIVKRNAPALLTQAFEKPSWKGERVVLSGNTDCYQPLELSWGITRSLLAICAAFRNPVGIITKSAIIQRDVDILQDLHRHAAVQVYVSIPFLDRAMSRSIEPGAPSPSKRLQTVQVLAEAGIPVGVALAPIIPGLNDDQIMPILEAAAEAGATSAFRSLIHFPEPVDQIFLESLENSYPDRVDKVRNAIREMRRGALTDERIGERFSGYGARWGMIAQLFDKTCDRLGLTHRRHEKSSFREEDTPDTFRRPGAQMELF